MISLQAGMATDPAFPCIALLSEAALNRDGFTGGPGFTRYRRNGGTPGDP